VSFVILVLDAFSQKLTPARIPSVRGAPFSPTNPDAARPGYGNATGTYAAMNLAGPHSRRVLESLTRVDLAPERFPYLGVREGEVAEVPARLLRVGFVGEWGYEIHVPVDSVAWVWERSTCVCSRGIETTTCGFRFRGVERPSPRYGGCHSAGTEHGASIEE